MSGKITVAICGMGIRGAEAYASYQKIRPEEMQVVAVADPRPEQRELAVREFHVKPELCFASGEELLAQKRLADVLIIATQDTDHVRYALPALEKGYHLLVEKPISPKLEECIALREKAHECHRIVIVCHVLRYTQFYQKIFDLLNSGTIGKLETFHATENVAYWHFAHSFVRGNWRRSDLSSPVILAKSCHDMDIFRWLVGKPCLRVSSFGSLDWFRAENAPAGSAMRCLDCAAKENCPYDAEKIYIYNKKSGYRSGTRFWPLTVLCPEPTEESLYEAMRTGPYGRCVYHCDNNVADHQVVNMEFADGVVGTFTMSAFTQDCYRTICLMGSMGEIEGNLEENAVYVRRFGQPEERIALDPVSDEFAGHGGGDSRMMEYMCRLASNGWQDSLTSVDASVESHIMALAAEESRLHDGAAIDLAEFAKK